MMQFVCELNADQVIVKYTGDYKINGIKAIRAVFGMGLLDSKNSIEADAGMRMTLRDLSILRTVYSTYEYDNKKMYGEDFQKLVVSEPVDLVR